MWTDDDWVPVSALEHYAYCPRQCALIHVEQTFEDNLWTVRGQLVHERVDQPTVEVRDGMRAERALPIWSEALGIRGRADLVELSPAGDPYPVEYKAGRLEFRAATIQLCAQALCLEEMFGRPVPEGALYLAAAHQRRPVAMAAELRQETISTIATTRLLLHKAETPPPFSDNRCRRCSLLDICLPHAVQLASAALEEWDHE